MVENTHTAGGGGGGGKLAPVLVVGPDGMQVLVIPRGDGGLSQNGFAAYKNTGSGGGGTGSDICSSYWWWFGGSGIVIIAYPT